PLACLDVGGRENARRDLGVPAILALAIGVFSALAGDLGGDLARGRLVTRRRWRNDRALRGLARRNGKLIGGFRGSLGWTVGGLFGHDHPGKSGASGPYIGANGQTANFNMAFRRRVPRVAVFPLAVSRTVFTIDYPGLPAGREIRPGERCRAASIVRSPPRLPI